MVVQLLTECSNSEAGNTPLSDRAKAFRMAHPNTRKCFIFLASSEEEASSWVECLRAASRAESRDFVETGNQ